MSNEKLVIFREIRFPVPAHITTLDQAKAVAMITTPQLGDAEGRVDNAGNFVFEKKAGTKGC